MRALSLLLLLVHTGSWAADTAPWGSLESLRGMFDGTSARPPAPLLLPFRRQARPALPEVAGAPVGVSKKDIFRATPECEIVDVVNVRQPSLAESVAALAPCAKALSAKLSVELGARADGKRILIALTGEKPAATAAADQLAEALAARDWRLFGHPAALWQPEGETTGTAPKVSSLQLVIDSCPTIAVVRRLETAAEFLKAYGACLIDARNLQVSSVAPDPVAPATVLVYSAASSAALSEMSGSVTVPSENGPARFLILPRRESLRANLLPPSLFGAQ